MCIYHIVFIHSSVNGLLGCYCEYCYCEYCCFVHGNVNFSLDSDCSSLDQIPRVGIAGSHSSSIFFFNFFWGISILFSIVGASACTLISSVQAFSSLLHPPPPRQHLLPLLKIAILEGVRWDLIMILICISLIISDIKHLFICLSVVCMSSLEKSVFKYLAHLIKF